MGGPLSLARKDFMYNECRHVMPSGLHCQSPAMRGSSFCYFHARPQRPARSHEVRIEMPDRLDSKATPATIHRTLQALAAGHISARRAAVLLYGIQMSSGQVPQDPDPGALERFRKLSRGNEGRIFLPLGPRTPPC
jgi:hypothetical protein